MCETSATNDSVFEGAGSNPSETSQPPPSLGRPYGNVQDWSRGSRLTVDRGTHHGRCGGGQKRRELSFPCSDDHLSGARVEGAILEDLTLLRSVPCPLQSAVWLVSVVIEKSSRRLKKDGRTVPVAPFIKWYIWTRRAMTEYPLICIRV